MPIARPSLADLIDAIRADFAARTAWRRDVQTRRSPIDAFSRVIGYVQHTTLGWLAWVAQQMLPDTADADWMIRHATLWGLSRRPASYATGTITVTGTPDTFIPEGTLWQRGDGIQYAQDNPLTINSIGSGEVVVTAIEAGVLGNAAPQSPVTLVSPQSGVVSMGTVAEFGIGAGAGREDDDELRARLLARIRQPPHGGNATDYVQWALSVPGVTRAWVFPRANGAGSVTVRFMMDDTYPDGIPQPNDVAAVAAFIDVVRPVTAEVIVVAPVPVTIVFNIRLIGVDTAAVRASVDAELRDLVIRESIPGSPLLISHIREAVSVSTGEIDHDIISPAANVATAPSEILIFGGIAWE